MNPKKDHRLLRAKTRHRARGAAMVEAAVVIPVMLVFLGLTMFIHNSYDEKLASQTSTRAQVLYYASHNCEGAAPESMAVQLGTKTSGNAGTQGGTATTGDDPGTGAGQRMGADSKAGLSRSYNLSKSHRDTSVGGSAVQEQKRVSFSVPVTSDSEVACNEKRFDNNWTAVFGYIKSFVRSGGGFIN